MALFSQTEIEMWTGFSSTSFKQAGVSMTATQFATFCTFLVDSVTQSMCRYCEVGSFESHTATQYYSGKGASGDDSVYLEQDTNFYIPEPCISVTTVEEDLAAKTAVPDWTAKTERSNAAAGDYIVVNDSGLTRVRFHNNYPLDGVANVRITYLGGFATGSREFNDLKQIGLRMAKNFCAVKKKIGEADTIRNTGVQDYAQMFDPIDERLIITPDIERDLTKYKQFNIGMFT